MATTAETPPRVIIIGAGFAGLYRRQALKNAPVDVLMIDQHNYHTFQPLLYQVATAGLSSDDIAHQVRDVFRRRKNFRFRQGTVAGVDWQQKRVQLKDDDSLVFDYLIIGAGAVYNDFGVPGVKEHAFLVKSLSEATNLRSHLLRMFELASAHPERIEDAILTFVIIGGGPTGVEMASTLMELFDRVLPQRLPGTRYLTQPGDPARDGRRAAGNLHRQDQSLHRKGASRPRRRPEVR